MNPGERTHFCVLIFPKGGECPQHIVFRNRWHWWLCNYTSLLARGGQRDLDESVVVLGRQIIGVSHDFVTVWEHWRLLGRKGVELKYHSPSLPASSLLCGWRTCQGIEFLFCSLINIHAFFPPWLTNLRPSMSHLACEKGTRKISVRQSEQNARRFAICLKLWVRNWNPNEYGNSNIFI
jgi:hypothetical protein